MSSHSQPQWICSTSNLIHSLGWGDPGEDPNPDLMAAASKLQRYSLQGRIQYEADQTTRGEKAQEEPRRQCIWGQSDYGIFYCGQHNCPACLFTRYFYRCENSTLHHSRLAGARPRLTKTVWFVRFLELNRQLHWISACVFRSFWCCHKTGSFSK